jgi:diguanylate cyclase (GGDEF)-like protein
VELLDTLREEWESHNFSIELRSPTNDVMVFNHMAGRKDNQYLTSLYPLARVSRTQSLGVTSLVLEMNSQVGFSLYALARIFLIIGALVSMLFLGATHTAHKRLAERTRQANLDAVFAEREKAERTLNSITDAVILLDAEHHIVHLNPAARQLINRPLTNTIGCLLPNLVRFKALDDKSDRFVLEDVLDGLSSGGESQFDIQPLDFGSSDSVFRMSLVRTHDADDMTSGFIVMLRDISNERKLNLKLQYQANHDPLTGCTNRYYFEHRLQELMIDLPRTNRQHAVVYMDLDQFKVINDTCGHTAGDLLLQELTQNLRSLVRKGDVLSRLGGDEFGFIFVDAAPKDARRVTNSLYQFFQNYVFSTDGKSFAVRASIGVVFVDQDSGPIKEVLSAADIACYEAKDAGRNSVFFYSDSEERMEARSSELNWLPKLQQALTDGNFHIYAQPLAALSQTSSHHPVTHFEFLLRLIEADGSVVTPWAFIQAAERYDLMRDIDRWVIKNAIESVAKLPAGVAQNFHFSINLSGQSAADSSVIDFIREQIDINQVPAELFWFELTETAAISHFSVANELFRSIRKLGAKVALDDFGSGLSSFGYLKNLPVDVLKIDGQFVRNIAKDKIDYEMVRAIHQVGRSMGIATVAEFVEDEAGLQKLIDIGVDYAQGYHIGKPMPVEDAFAEYCMKKAA